MNSDVREALAPLPAPYRQYMQQLTDLMRADERARALWLSGSVARGDTDPGSDLDVILTIADDALEDFLDHWRKWVNRFCEPLIADQVPGARGVLTILTRDMCRIDLVVEGVTEVSASPHRRRAMVLDRDDLASTIPEPEALPGPDAAAIGAMITEFWRVQAIVPDMVDGRGDMLAALAGIHLGHRLLYDTFVACNQPLPPMGIKRFRAKLTDEQAQVLLELPPTAADRQSVIAASRALSQAMSSAGRTCAEAVGAQYPTEVAEAVMRYLRRTVWDT